MGGQREHKTHSPQSVAPIFPVGDGPTNVYFIGEAGGKGAVKIGMSRDPASRLSALQTGNPRKLILHYSVPAMPAAEGLIHAWLGPDRIQGEWFRRDAAMRAIERLKRLAAARPEPAKGVITISGPGDPPRDPAPAPLTPLSPPRPSLVPEPGRSAEVAPITIGAPRPAPELMLSGELQRISMAWTDGEGLPLALPGADGRLAVPVVRWATLPEGGLDTARLHEAEVVPWVLAAAEADALGELARRWRLDRHDVWVRRVGGRLRLEPCAWSALASAARRKNDLARRIYPRLVREVEDFRRKTAV